MITRLLGAIDLIDIFYSRVIAPLFWKSSKREQSYSRMATEKIMLREWGDPKQIEAKLKRHGVQFARGNYTKEGRYLIVRKNQARWAEWVLKNGNEAKIKWGEQRKGRPQRTRPPRQRIGR